MNLIKSRWPFLVLAVAAIGYVAQFYRVEGLDKLRIKRKPGTLHADGESSSIVGATSSWFGEDPATGVSGSSLFDISTIASRERDEPTNSHSAKLLTKTVPSNPPPNLRPLRVGSFSLMTANNAVTLRDEKTFQVFVQICSRFDVLALQELSPRDAAALPAIVASIHDGGSSFDYLLGPAVGREGNIAQMAFLFNTNRLESDQDHLYCVDDPDNLLLRKPLVGWFRAKESPSHQAFTFTLVSVAVNPNSRFEEVRLIPELAKSILIDGRREDDIIFVGDFQSSERQLLDLRSLGWQTAISDLATTVRGDRMLDNMLIHSGVTREFNGRAGVIDFIREFNLTLQEAEALSSHLPIGAEFSPLEFVGQATH